LDSPGRRNGRSRKQPNRAPKHPPGQNPASPLKFTPKHIGSVAEMAFMLRASLRGCAVAKPFGEAEHYDVLVDARTHIWRVQVKIATPQKHNGFSFRSCWAGYKGLVPYTPEEIDFLAAFIRQHDIWYLIPATEIKGRLLLNVHPFGTLRHRQNTHEFEKFREAWPLLTT